MQIMWLQHSVSSVRWAECNLQQSPCCVFMVKQPCLWSHIVCRATAGGINDVADEGIISLEKRPSKFFQIYTLQLIISNTGLDLFFLSENALHVQATH